VLHEESTEETEIRRSRSATCTCTFDRSGYRWIQLLLTMDNCSCSVFRDWCFVESTPDEVYKDLFTSEQGQCNEVAVRNLARSELVAAFETITVWLFPVPVTSAASLKDKIRFDQLSVPFQEKLRALRSKLSTQLKQPTTFHEQPVTGKLLLRIVPILVDALNKDQDIVPESIYMGMVRADANRAELEFKKALESLINDKTSEWAASADLQSDLLVLAKQLADAAIRSMLRAPAHVVDQSRDVMNLHAADVLSKVTHANEKKLFRRLAAAANLSISRLNEEFSRLVELIPTAGSTLKKTWRNLVDKEQAQLQSLALGCHRADDALRRVGECAAALLEKLVEANDDATRTALAKEQHHIQLSLGQLTSDIDAILCNKRPISLELVVSNIERSVSSLSQELCGFGIGSSIGVDYRPQLETYKMLTTDYATRKYSMVVQTLLLEVKQEACTQLQREARLRLETQLPIHEERVGFEVMDAVKNSQQMITKGLYGWTISADDVEAAYSAVANLGHQVGLVPVLNVDTHTIANFAMLTTSSSKML
jgi:hypothetical protein